MKIIGIGHYSRVGKDTLANAMIEWFGQFYPELTIKKLPFAWKLKKITHELYAWTGLREPEFYETPEGEKHRDIVLPDLGMTPVEIWVKFGTDAVRNQVYQNTWIKYVTKGDHKADIVIVPDVRFPNEVEAMQQAGAKLVKAVRPGYGPRPTKADRALVGYTGWDYVVGASGEIAELRRWAARFAVALVAERRAESGLEVLPVWPIQSIDEKAAALAVEVIEPWERREPIMPDTNPLKSQRQKDDLAGYRRDAVPVSSDRGPPGYGSRSTIGGFIKGGGDAVPAMLNTACCSVVRRINDGKGPVMPGEVLSVTPTIQVGDV